MKLDRIILGSGVSGRWLSSSRAHVQFSKLHAASCDELIQKTVVSSAYIHINISPDLIDEGRLFVNNINRVLVLKPNPVELHTWRAVLFSAISKNRS